MCLKNFEQVLQTFAQSSKQKFADEPTTTRRPSGPNSKLRDLSKYEIVRAGSTKFKLLNNLKIPPFKPLLRHQIDAIFAHIYPYFHQNTIWSLDTKQGKCHMTANLKSGMIFQSVFRAPHNSPQNGAGVEFFNVTHKASEA